MNKSSSILLPEYFLIFRLARLFYPDLHTSPLGLHDRRFWIIHLLGQKVSCMLNMEGILQQRSSYRLDEAFRGFGEYLVSIFFSLSVITVYQLERTRVDDKK